MFKKILVANRGEIALRIQRACRELGIKAVMVYSEADRDAKYVKLADEAVCIGPAPSPLSYLNMPAIISAAEVTDAEAIHPGYGFLSENADFAERVEKSGFQFIGPTPESIRIMGDKVSAKQAMIKAGVPCVPGSEGELPTTRCRSAASPAVGYPVIIKAAGGGGGRGMRVVHTEAALINAVQMTKAEAGAAFGNPAVYMEKFLQNPRHIEIQILADKHRNAVYLGERDCSMQRRHQKVIEEGAGARHSAQADRAHRRALRGGLQEDRLPRRGHLRISVRERRVLFHRDEHPRAGGAPGDRDDHRCGHCQDADHGGRGRKAAVYPARHPDPRPCHRMPHQCRRPLQVHPSPGRITMWHAPGGPGVRVDSHVYTNYFVPPNYDSMIGKIIVHGDTREQAMARMRTALAETVVEGINTNIPLAPRADGGRQVHGPAAPTSTTLKSGFQHKNAADV
jgi:acetyl-CoA carboxylase biotin carboxylase subunit